MNGFVFLRRSRSVDPEYMPALLIGTLVGVVTMKLLEKQMPDKPQLVKILSLCATCAVILIVIALTHKQ